MSTQQTQQQYLFFDPTPDRSNPHLPSAPTKKFITEFLASDECPLNQIVVGEKNQAGLHTLRLAAFAALCRSNHSCRGMSFGIYSGPGQGKTSVVKAWAKTIGIPFVFIQSDALQSTWHLFEEIAKVHAQHNPLVPQKDNTQFTIPPCIVFFDEAHALSKDLRTGGLLNAMELNDGWLRVTAPGKNGQTYLVDTSHICWVAATTDPGILFAQSEAFYTRLSNHVVWHAAGKKEVSKIVNSKHPHLSEEACDIVAHYVRNPRVAISFANQMIVERSMQSCSWEDAARTIARIQGIDDHGMTFQQINILKALGQKPIAANRLPIFANCRKEELEKMILPALLDDHDGHGPFVEVTSKGYTLTRSGLMELLKRNISYRGDQVLAENVA